MVPEGCCVYHDLGWFDAVDRLVADISVCAEHGDVIFSLQLIVHHFQHLVVADSVFFQHKLVRFVHDVEVVQSVCYDSTDIEIILFGQLIGCLFIDVCSLALFYLQAVEFIGKSYFCSFLLALVELRVDDVPTQFGLNLHLIF